MQDVISKYNASKHPDVISGRRSAGDVLREFLDTFDVGGVKDGIVSLEEFENYYSNVSASIDDDVYFELMIRNAWHISGGEGQAANSSNRRVLVRSADGYESVQEIRNDLGVGSKDKAAMASRLGVREDQIGLTAGGKNGIGDSEQKAASRPPPQRLLAPRSGNDYLIPPAPPVGKRRVECAASKSTGLSDALFGTGNNVSENVNDFTGTSSNGDGFDILKTRKLISAGKDAVARLRSKVLSGGLSGIVQLQKKFHQFDVDCSKMLSLEEFEQAMVECSVRLPADETKKLFSYFDRDISGTVTFDEFLVAIRVSKLKLFFFEFSMLFFIDRVN